MSYEDDYKMWLEKMLIESNPDLICDGMYDMDFTHEWCGKHCGEDSDYVTPKCLHMFYHHIARADRKTENSSEIPNKCETCKHHDKYGCEYPCDECEGCDKWEQTEPQTDEEYINNLPWTEVGNGEQTDEPQTDCP